MARRTGPRILVFAYHFPPMGGAGAQRAIKLVRRLTEIGWDPVVVTREGRADERYNPRDEQLATQLPADLEVHRVPGAEPDLVHGNGWSSRPSASSGGSTHALAGGLLGPRRPR
jgi:hypothetical protein